MIDMVHSASSNNSLMSYGVKNEVCCPHFPIRGEDQWKSHFNSKPKPAMNNKKAAAAQKSFHFPTNKVALRQ